MQRNDTASKVPNWGVARFAVLSAPVAKSDDRIPLAARHVREAERIVIEQRARIEHLKAVGADTAAAEETLHIFEASLRILDDHLQWLQRR